MPERILLNQPMAYSSYQEHANRYFFVKDLVRSRKVLDLACGTGYGSCFLASVAKTVIGCDLSADALAFAAKSYRRYNLLFVRASAPHLPFRDQCFEVVVSFETIEHLEGKDQLLYLGEISRALQDGRYFICSTPRKEVIKGLHGEKWSPYHLQELSTEEFKQLLDQHFNVVSWYGQGVIPGTTVLRMMLKYILAKMMGQSLRSEVKRRMNRLLNPESWDDSRRVIEPPEIEEEKLDKRYFPLRTSRYGRYSPIVAIAIATKGEASSSNLASTINVEPGR
jgi:ubiquinone/menaquinone biosynthesis C-methylase UbiE